jgi:hypothetical protein
MVLESINNLNALGALSLMNFNSLFSILTLETGPQAKQEDVAEFALDESSRLQVITVYNPASLNKAALQCVGDWILFVQPHAKTAVNLLERVKMLLNSRANVDCFVPQRGAALPKQEATLLDYLNRLSPSGLLIRKSFLIEVGGFNESCASFVDVEFFLRCVMPHKDRMALYPTSDLQLNEHPNTCVRLGVDRVLKATQLVRNNVGSSPAVWFEDYAEALMQMVRDEQDARLTIESARGHLTKLASKLDYWVSHSGQAVLGRFLNRSVFEGPTPEGAEQVDKIVRAAFPDQQRGCQLPDQFNAFSVGNFCHAAQLLKGLALRKHTGPLDWLFSNVKATTHILESDFEQLLDPALCETAKSDEKLDPLSNVAHNRYYRENFGVRFMYNHHDLNKQQDLQLFTRAANHMREALESEAPTFLLMTTLYQNDFDHLEGLVEVLQERGPNNVLVVVALSYVDDASAADQAVTLHTTPDGSVFVCVLPVNSKSNGMEFPLEQDNIRLQRLVHGIALGRFGLPA